MWILIKVEDLEQEFLFNLLVQYGFTPGEILNDGINTIISEITTVAENDEGIEILYRIQEYKKNSSKMTEPDQILTQMV